MSILTDAKYDELQDYVLLCFRDFYSTEICAEETARLIINRISRETLKMMWGLDKYEEFSFEVDAIYPRRFG